MTPALAPLCALCPSVGSSQRTLNAFGSGLFRFFQPMPRFLAISMF